MSKSPIEGRVDRALAVAYCNEMLCGEFVSTHTVATVYPGSIRFWLKGSMTDPHNSYTQHLLTLTAKLGCPPHMHEDYGLFRAARWDIDDLRRIELRVTDLRVTIRLSDHAYTIGGIT